MIKFEVIDCNGDHVFVDAETWYVDGDCLYFYVSGEIITGFRDWRLFRRYHE